MSLRLKWKEDSYVGRDLKLWWRRFTSLFVLFWMLWISYIVTIIFLTFDSSVGRAVDCSCEQLISIGRWFNSGSKEVIFKCIFLFISADLNKFATGKKNPSSCLGRTSSKCQFLLTLANFFWHIIYVVYSETYYFNRIQITHDNNKKNSKNFHFIFY